jgi:RsiW-degrading membrane proteinase PrsW (M82 family)
MRLGAIFIWVLLIAVTAMIVGAIFDFVPWDICRYLGYVIVPLAVLWFLWSWFKWHAKQRGDQNELDVLEETVQEHERGRHDDTEYIKKQIFFVERDHKRTPEVQRLLDRARRAIED